MSSSFFKSGTNSRNASKRPHSLLAIDGDIGAIFGAPLFIHKIAPRSYPGMFLVIAANVNDMVQGIIFIGVGLANMLCGSVGRYLQGLLRQALVRVMGSRRVE